MTNRRPISKVASTLVITLVTLTALSLMAAYTLVRVLPRIRMAYQNAAWQEARVAAEAGIDIAMNDLLVNASGISNGDWVGWQEETPPVVPGKPAPPPPPTNKGPDGPAAKIAKALAKPPKPPKPPKKGAPLPPPNPVVATAPAYLDNIKVSATKGVVSQVDIRLWGLTRDGAAHKQWFRIRSMATCALPPRAFEVPANLDALLRRFSLRNVRPRLQKDDAGKPSTVGLPNVSRTVEALVEPILPFELALWTGHSIVLSTTGAWNIDSFDSSDDTKSASGLYPGRGSAPIQANGSVATSQGRAFDSLYGPLIAANGTEIRGAVATNGGDDPNTSDHENVSGALRIDPARIRSDFAREMPPLQRPTVTTALPPPAAGASYLPGPLTDPTIYAVPGSVTDLHITAPADKSDAGIAILIDGDLDLAGPLIIPPTVTALIYVRGNITFRDNVNSGPWNSNRANQLLIFADGNSPAHQVLQTPGEFSVCAAFYGPVADVTLDGRTTWIGSIAASSFRVNGGGDGGLHYDEALSTVGPPISFRISRYIEDVRQ